MTILAMALAMAPAAVFAEPIEVSSPDLRPIQVKSNRAMGRILVKANFSSHRISVDGAEYPAYLSEYGIEVTSNELHDITVTNNAGVEKKYRLSVNPGETMMLYVDLGGTQKDNKDKKKDDKKQNNDATTGFLTVTAESEAQVYIDGKLLSAKTPLKKHEVPTGSHTIRVYFFDTKKFSKSREIYVGKGATMSMNFTKDK